MNAFDIDFILMKFGSFGLEPTKRNRMAFALGMRDDRRGDYAGENFVNNGFESDCYWAGREVGKEVGRRGMAVTMSLAEISLM